MNTFRITVIVCLAGLAGCSASNPVTVNPDYQMNVSDAERRQRLADWFNCDECVNGQLRRVQELGNLVVDDLDGLMQDGDDIQVNGVNLALADTAAVVQSRCTRYTTGLPGALVAPIDTAACRQRFEANRAQRVEARAKVALMAIRTRAACNRLDAMGGDICNNPDLKQFFPTIFIPDSDRSIRRID